MALYEIVLESQNPCGGSEYAIREIFEIETDDPEAYPLLIPAYDYCMPEKECTCACGEDCQRDPCELFREVQFPVNEFFPSSTIPPRGDNGYQSIHNSCCGC